MIYSATSDLLLMISVEKRPYLGSNLVPTLANLQVHDFTHFVRLRPVGGYNLTQALQLPRTEPSVALSATPSTAQPQGPFYTRGSVTASQGSSQPQALHQGLFAAWVQVQQHRCTTEWLGKQHFHMHPLPGLCAAVWCMNICAYSVCVSLFCIRHNIYSNICAYVEIIAQSE